MLETSRLAEKAAKKARDCAGTGKRVIVVVPNNSHLAALTRPDADPAIIKLDQLETVIKGAAMSPPEAATTGDSRPLSL